MNNVMKNSEIFSDFVQDEKASIGIQNFLEITVSQQNCKLSSESMNKYELIKLKARIFRV